MQQNKGVTHSRYFKKACSEGLVGNPKPKQVELRRRERTYLFCQCHSRQVARYRTPGYQLQYCSFVMCCHYSWGLKAQIFWRQNCPLILHKPNWKKQGETSCRIFWHNSHLASLSCFQLRLVRMWRWWSITVGVKWASAVEAGCANARCNHWNCILRGQKWGHPNSPWLPRQVLQWSMTRGTKENYQVKKDFPNLHREQVWCKNRNVKYSRRSSSKIALYYESILHLLSSLSFPYCWCNNMEMMVPAMLCSKNNIWKVLFIA